MRVGIVGLGLIGGSMAKAAAALNTHVVWGRDTDPAVMKAALACGAVQGGLTDGRLAACDLVLLALAPSALLREALRIAPLLGRQTCLVDLCGVKGTVAGAIRPLAARYGFCYVGGHPMAGKEKGGFAHSDPSLFKGASMILVPGEEPLPEGLSDFFLSLGFGRVTFCDADTHDRHIAYTSQLAHVVSSAYVMSDEALQHAGFSAGSFKDMTRVATLDEEMWTSLFLANREHLNTELKRLISRLAAFADALDAADADALRAMLAAGREQKAKTLKGDSET